MLYVTRGRYKESVKGEDLLEINKFTDTELIPAVEKVEGVRSAQAYNSITGELTFVLDIRDLATIDRLLADPGCKAVLGKTLAFMVRTGGEVLYDCPLWQEMYGKS